MARSSNAGTLVPDGGEVFNGSLPLPWNIRLSKMHLHDGLARARCVEIMVRRDNKPTCSLCYSECSAAGAVVVDFPLDRSIVCRGNLRSGYDKVDSTQRPPPLPALLDRETLISRSGYIVNRLIWMRGFREVVFEVHYVAEIVSPGRESNA